MTTTQSKPLVSVIMPVYNAEKYLEEALVSILIQTFRDFEVLAINDGSTDSSLAILERYAKNDPRIRIISQENSGIVVVLNRGIQEAHGAYIARMDSDDVSFPNRFKDQVEILNSDPTISLVAGDFEVINEASEFLYRELVLPDDNAMKRALFVRNPIAHGSVMFRRSVIDAVGDYSDNVGPTEDLDLWMRIAKVGTFAATASPVYKWRMNTQGVTLTNNALSMHHLKQHLSAYWEDHSPEYVSRNELLSICKQYLGHNSKHAAYYKELFLTDTSQIAAKLIARKKIWLGIKQLFVIASTGRIGVRIVLKRLHLIGSGRYQSLAKRISNSD